MTDLRLIQEFREIGDTVPAGSDNPEILSEVGNIIQEITSTLLACYNKQIPNLPFPRAIDSLTPSSFPRLAETLFSNLVLHLNHPQPYTSFAAKVGRIFLNSLQSSLTNNDRNCIRVGHLATMAVCHKFKNLISIKRGRVVGVVQSKNPPYLISRSPDLDRYANALQVCPKLNFLPMICEPDSWTDVYSGGYISNGVHYFTPFIRSHRAIKADSFQDFDLYIKAVNYIQSTPWMIDTFMLDLVKVAKRGRWQVKKFPHNAELPEIPDYPYQGDKRPFAELDEDEQSKVKEWIRFRANIERHRQSMISKRISIDRAIDIADAYSDYEAIWFPHSLDYRGRVYPIPAHLHPQASDGIKAMLCHSHAEPLKGDEAIFYTKVHIANLFGQDKLSYSDRVAWFDENEEDILRAGADPYTNEWWWSVDKPWQFIQACREWYKYKMDPTAPVRFLIAMDGSCSGIQHFSSMLRDPVSGASVNLLPSDSPKDIYQDVADICHTKINSLSGQMAQIWQESGINRSLTKRPVMTFPYSLTKYTCEEYVSDWILESEFDCKGFKVRPMSKWLNNHLWNVIRSHLKGPSQVMDYLQECVQVAAEHDQPLEWKTPGNLIVEKIKYTSKKVDCKVNMACAIRGKTRVRLTLQVPTHNLDVKKLKSSIAPNFVHSYDAVHLCMVAEYVADEGIPGICAIHDSLASHPNYAAELYLAIRQRFVDLYRNVNVLEDMREYMLSEYSIELPPPPEFPDNELDFDQVHISPYIFS